MPDPTHCLIALGARVTPPGVHSHDAASAPDKPAAPAAPTSLWHQRIMFADGSIAARRTALAAWEPIRPARTGSKTPQAAEFAARQNRLAKWPQPPCPFAADSPAQIARPAAEE